jgi:iron complex transport system substrate-binding protein
VRIVSFLPAASEMVCALGLEESLVGVSHECDFPAAAKTRPAVVHPAMALASLGPAEIDDAVRARLRSADSLYAIDETLLRALRPDLILTQDLCQVCAPSGNDATRVLASLAPRPDVLYLSPRSLRDVTENLRAVARATNTVARAETIIAEQERRLDAVARAVGKAPRPTVFFAEWVEPIYCAGHWVPEMIERAGGIPLLGNPNGESVRIERTAAIAARPDVVIVAPCGYSLNGALAQAPRLGVRAERTYAVDANAYFARPGPRLVDGVELLAHLLHPDRVAWSGDASAFSTV